MSTFFWWKFLLHNSPSIIFIFFSILIHFESFNSRYSFEIIGSFNLFNFQSPFELIDIYSKFSSVFLRIVVYLLLFNIPFSFSFIFDCSMNWHSYILIYYFHWYSTIKKTTHRVPHGFLEFPTKNHFHSLNLNLGYIRKEQTLLSLVTENRKLQLSSFFVDTLMVLYSEFSTRDLIRYSCPQLHTAAFIRLHDSRYAKSNLELF